MAAVASLCGGVVVVFFFGRLFAALLGMALPMKRRARNMLGTVGAVVVGTVIVVAVTGAPHLAPMYWIAGLVLLLVDALRGNAPEEELAAAAEDTSRVMAPPQMACRSCGSANDDDATFCSTCSARLACESCGARNGASAAFCKGCGARLPRRATPEPVLPSKARQEDRAFPGGMWACSRCSTVNSVDADYCDGCSSPRD